MEFTESLAWRNEVAATNTVYCGSGFDITEKEGKYWISWEQGIFGKTVQYEISKDNVEKAMRSDQDSYEVMIFAETGGWPLTEEQMMERTMDFIRDNPYLLLKVPSNQKMFSSICVARENRPQWHPQWQTVANRWKCKWESNKMLITKTSHTEKVC